MILEKNWWDSIIKFSVTVRKPESEKNTYLLRKMKRFNEKNKSKIYQYKQAEPKKLEQPKKIFKFQSDEKTVNSEVEQNEHIEQKVEHAPVILSREQIKKNRQLMFYGEKIEASEKIHTDRFATKRREKRIGRIDKWIKPLDKDTYNQYQKRVEFLTNIDNCIDNIPVIDDKSLPKVENVKYDPEDLCLHRFGIL